MRGPRRALILFAATVLVLAAAVIAAAAVTRTTAGPSPDRPAFAQGDESAANYLELRDEWEARVRGIEPGQFFNPLWRTAAVQERQRQEAGRRLVGPKSSTTWTEIGPDIVTNGQALDGSDTPVSGRVTSIAIDPTNSSKVYLGTADGGVWRSLNGGATWTPIFDSAQSLAIGALAVAPSSPSTLYVGTGEANRSVDSFFGVGIYRIDNADTSATLVGPINPSMTFNCNPSVCSGSFTTNAFTGRSVSQILVDPSDAATIFVSTTTGFGGMGANALSGFIPPVGRLGVYRSANATSAAGSVTFQKLAVITGGGAANFDNPPTGDRRIGDITFLNGDPNVLIASAFGAGGANDGAIFRSTNALAGTPSFTEVLGGVSISRIVFADAHDGSTLLAATTENPGLISGNQGRLRKSTDGGVTWTTFLTAADGFCGGQCFYDLPVGIDPHTSGANLRIYLGGNARGTNSDGMKLSNDAGATFTRDDTGIHADAHAIVFDSSTNPSTVWIGNDGGVWKRNASLAAGSAWTDENSGLGTLQFESVAVGKSDAAFGIGGTQDNGTEIQQTSVGNWSQADFGDGGYARIDQSTTSTSAVTMYHTYFNATNSLIGFGRVTNVSSAFKGGWSFLGCQNVPPPTSNNGLGCGDNVEFYAPMALGPGTPNTLYFGTDRLYRSTDSGTTMSCGCASSISGGSPITAIGISPQDDNYRIVGLQNGQVWATTTGASTLTQMTGLTAPANATGSTTNKWVGRAVIDPNDKNTAYVTFSYYAASGAGVNVWKTTNLNAGTPIWTAVASLIPNVPVNAFAVDPNNSQDLFVGTDVGVYASTNGGTSWSPLGTGLPEVAVFDMAIVQPGTSTEKLRIATHGRSMWEIDLTSVPTAVAVESFGARRIGAGVRLSWRTRAETQIAGFNVFRDGRRLNGRLIAAKRAGQAGGASYRFLDRTALRGHVYTFRLQIVDLRGKASWFRVSSKAALR